MEVGITTASQGLYMRSTVECQPQNYRQPMRDMSWQTQLSNRIVDPRVHFDQLMVLEYIMPFPTLTFSLPVECIRLALPKLFLHRPTYRTSLLKVLANHPLLVKWSSDLLCGTANRSFGCPRLLARSGRD